MSRFGDCRDEFREKTENIRPRTRLGASQWPARCTTAALEIVGGPLAGHQRLDVRLPRSCRFIFLVAFAELLNDCLICFGEYSNVIVLRS